MSVVVAKNHTTPEPSSIKHGRTSLVLPSLGPRLPCLATRILITINNTPFDGNNRACAESKTAISVLTSQEEHQAPCPTLAASARALRRPPQILPHD